MSASNRFAHLADDDDGVDATARQTKDRGSAGRSPHDHPHHTDSAEQIAARASKLLRRSFDRQEKSTSSLADSAASLFIKAADAFATEAARVAEGSVDNLSRRLRVGGCYAHCGECLMRAAKLRAIEGNFENLAELFYEPALNAVLRGTTEVDAVHAVLEANQGSEGMGASTGVSSGSSGPSPLAKIHDTSTAIDMILEDAGELQGELERKRERLLERLSESRGERDVVKASIGEERWARNTSKQSDYAGKRAEMERQLRYIERALKGIEAAEPKKQALAGLRSTTTAQKDSHTAV